MDALLKKAAPEEKNPPALLRQIIEKYPPEVAVRLSNVLPAHVGAVETSNLKRLEQSLLWPALLKIEFSNQELESLYAATASNEVGGYGLESSSEVNFSKRLSELNSRETAAVVAIAIQPQIKQKPEQLALTTKRILSVSGISP
jgi:hypothetical protein